MELYTNKERMFFELRGITVGTESMLGVSVKKLGSWEEKQSGPKRQDK